MGIKNFIKFINKYAPDCITYKKITDYKNTTVGIDANLLIYKLIYAIRTNGYDIRNNDKIVTHIHALLIKLIAFNKYNITPIFVFDNKPPAIKYNTLDSRTESKNKIIDKYKNSKTKEGKRIYYYVKSNITNREVIECKILIQLFGFMIIDAVEEADAQLAYLSKKKLINFIVSDDMDILLFGGNILLKKFSVDENKFIEEINLDKLKKILHISHQQLIYIGILLGCDYCQNKTLSITKTFNAINNNTDDLTILDQCVDAVNYFKKPPVNIINKLIKQKLINANSIVNYLYYFQFSNTYIDKVKKLII